MESLNALEKISNKLQGWLDAIIRNLPNLGVALLVMIISYIVSRYVFKFSFKLAQKKISQRSISMLVARTMAVFVVFLGLFLALGALNLGKTLTGLLTGAGISGLVIGLALQGTLSNTISGIVLAFRKNIRIGDWIETTGFSGEVMDINLNYFVMKEADNNIVVIPNKQILENPFKNYSLTTKMRITIECGVAYDSNLDKVEEVTVKTIRKFFNQKDIGKEVEFYYTEFGGSSINFMCRFWIDAERSLEKLESKSKAIKEIKRVFDAEGFNIPFPIRTIQFDNRLSVDNSNQSEN